MAVKDGLSPRPVAQTAKRYFLNRLEIIASNLDFTCVSALPTATLLVSSWSWLSFCTAPVQAGVQGPCRTLKHHGSEGRIGPAACSPDCQILFSAPISNYSSKLQTLTLPAFLHCQLPPCLCPPGAGFRSAQLRSKLESKDRVAELKHHGSEGWARGP